MENRIPILYKNPHEKLMKCVYRITIGDKFYIGRTRQLDQRTKSHENYINRAIENYGLLRLYLRDGETDPLYSSRYYIWFAQYLIEHPSVKEMTVEALYHSPYQEQISYYENSRLKLIANHPDCLNNIFKSTIDKGNQWEYSCKKVGNFVYYYDTTNPNELIPCTYNLYNTGSYNYPQKLKKELKLRRLGV